MPSVFKENLNMGSYFLLLVSELECPSVFVFCFYVIYLCTYILCSLDWIGRCYFSNQFLKHFKQELANLFHLSNSWVLYMICNFNTQILEVHREALDFSLCFSINFSYVITKIICSCTSALHIGMLKLEQCDWNFRLQVLILTELLLPHSLGRCFLHQ